MLRRWAATVLMVAACSGQAAWGQVKLSLKQRENHKSVTHSQMKMKQTLTLAGMAIDSANETFIVSTLTTGPRGVDGSLVQEEKVETLQANISLPGGQSIQFDSGNPGKKADNAMFEPILDGLRASLRMVPKTTYDKDNKITKIEFPKDVLDTLSEAVKKAYDPEKRLKAVKSDAEFLPDGEVKEGDTWERTSETPLGGGQTFTFTREYKYGGTVNKDGKTLHKVTSTVKSVQYSMDPDPQAQAKVTASDLKATESERETLIDLEAGAITSSKTKVRVEGDMRFEIGGMKLPGKIDLTLETSNTLQP